MVSERRRERRHLEDARLFRRLSEELRTHCDPKQDDQDEEGRPKEVLRAGGGLDEEGRVVVARGGARPCHGGVMSTLKAGCATRQPALGV